MMLIFLKKGFFIFFATDQPGDLYFRSRRELVIMVKNESNQGRRLTGKTAVVTGSSRGIGREIALIFASQGANVVVNYVNNQEAAEKTAAEIGQTGAEALVIQADVTRREQIRALFEKTYARFDKIDILVNNAGINKRGFFEEANEEDWD